MSSRKSSIPSHISSISLRTPHVSTIPSHISSISSRTPHVSSRPSLHASEISFRISSTPSSHASEISSTSSYRTPISTIPSHILTKIPTLPEEQQQTLSEIKRRLINYLKICLNNIKKILKENINEDLKNDLMRCSKLINQILLQGDDGIYNDLESNIKDFKEFLNIIYRHTLNKKIAINIWRFLSDDIMLEITNINTYYRILKETLQDYIKTGGLKITKNKIKVLYKKKEYIRTVYKNKKFIKINNKIIYLSELKK